VTDRPTDVRTELLQYSDDRTFLPSEWQLLSGCQWLER